MSSQPKIPTTGSRTKLCASIEDFLKKHPSLHLGGDEEFTKERREHLEIFGLLNIPKDQQHSIGAVEFTALRGPHGTIPVRVFYPASGEHKRDSGEAGGLIYFHGGGYTVGSVDEFENGLRMLAEESGVQVYGIDYRLAPEFKFPTQLDEYSALIDALQSDFGKARGVHPDRVCGGGDSAGGNMTAAICLRRRDEGKSPWLDRYIEVVWHQPHVQADMLYHRLPFDTPAASENNSGYYLECNGIFKFADHYLPRGLPLAHPHVSPGMQNTDFLSDVPQAANYTSGFDPLRDVGVEYASKLQEAGNEGLVWRHYDDMTHGWLQMTAWSEEAGRAVRDVAGDLSKVCYGIKRKVALNSLHIDPDKTL